VSAVGQDILGFQHAAFGGLALGVWMSVECAEEAPAMRARLARGERPGSERVAAILAACRTWPHGESPADFHNLVRSNAPVLLLASAFEPNYPAELVARAAAGFSHVRIVLDVNHGHVFDDDWPMCLEPQAVAFLDTLDLDALDTRCAAKFRFRPFKLPKVG
jgi:pimeloyl-ACP methyl ester carboxylesterase